MASSSPVGSSPSKPFTAPSKRYVSKVYSRRSAGGSVDSAPKRTKRTPTPESGTESANDGNVEKATLPNGDEVILGERLSDSDDEPPKPVITKKEVKEKPKAKLGLPATRQAPVKGKKAVRGKNGQVKAERPTPKSAAAAAVEEASKSAFPAAESSQRRSGKRKADIVRTDTEVSISSAPEGDTPFPEYDAEVDVPPIRLQPATSSPSTSQALPSQSNPPSTPPRKKTKRNPLTPHSSPRDLSALFAPVSPARSPALTRRNTSTDALSSGDGGQSKRANGGLFRRMLDKTQSLGNVASPAKSNGGDAGGFGEGDFMAGSPSSASNLIRTHSMPTTPSKSPLKEEVSPIGQSLIVPIASSSRLETTNMGSGGKGKRTYGRSRTILAETNESPGSGVDSVGERDVVKESYAELRKQFEVDNSGEDTGSGNLMMDLLAVRGGQSVSDLRSKGENRRFMDELGYLVDPIMDSGTSIGLKRSSIYDILRSMQDEEWLQRAKICGQVERIWEAIYEARGEGGDEIIEAMCLLYLVNLVKSGSGLELILRSHDETCERILLASLKVRDGPLDETPRVKPVGTVVKLRNMYQEVDLGWHSDKMSTRRLASHLLAQITSPSVRPSTSSGSLFVTDKAVSRIVKTLAVDIAELADRFVMVEKGLPLIPVDRNVHIDIDHISQSLLVLSRLVAQGLDDRQALAEMHGSAVSVIVDSLVAGLHLALNDTVLNELGSSMTIRTLQTLVTMSNASSDWSTSIPTISGALTALARVLLQRSTLVATAPSATEAEDEVEAMVLDDEDENEEARFFSPKKSRAKSPAREVMSEEDVLCLVLVILTASLGSETMIERLAILRIDGRCNGSKSCLLSCKCPKADLFAAHLIETYTHHQDSEATAASLIAAYLALILSKLILHSPALLDLFPGKNKHTEVVSLIDVLSDLKGLQSLLHTRLKVAAGLGAEGDGEGEGARDVGMEGGEGVEGDEGDAGVVNSAIEDLRRLASELEE